ncbi:hypothetical protein KO528_01350 [Saccharophagus degradans]|uniref:hypothetical protein n=1 Tax=Saccharophagus degradans TaxID=86304 RepID=UPI001C08FA8F|nr:hypothetical protein [Saccharophagus degradans]MBU2983983.1 hypothetical protein [Saccharophagus degradans]
MTFEEFIRKCEAKSRLSPEEIKMMKDSLNRMRELTDIERKSYVQEQELEDVTAQFYQLGEKGYPEFREEIGVKSSSGYKGVVLFILIGFLLVGGYFIGG